MATSSLRRPERRAVQLLGVLTASALAYAPAASAHDGPPTLTNLFAPADAPGRITVGSTFGILTSHDEGRSWRLACETPETYADAAYRAGPTRTPILYALSAGRVLFSEDEGCNFAISPSHGATQVLALHPDAGERDRLWLVEKVLIGAGAYGNSLRLAQGSTSRRVLLTEAGWEIWGVHAANELLAVTLAPSELAPSFLALSHDSGESFTERSLENVLGNDRASLLDADAARKEILLRVLSPDADRLAWSVDAGETFAVSDPLPGFIRGFARSGDTLYLALVGSTADLSLISLGPALVPELLYRDPRTPLALQFRDGVLYLLMTDVNTPGALLRSHDGGLSFESALDWRSVQLKSSCDDVSNCGLACPRLTQAARVDCSLCSPAGSESLGAGRCSGESTNDDPSEPSAPAGNEPHDERPSCAWRRNSTSSAVNTAASWLALAAVALGLRRRSGARSCVRTGPARKR